jgi:hypothetical protein
VKEMNQSILISSWQESGFMRLSPLRSWSLISQIYVIYNVINVSETLMQLWVYDTNSSFVKTGPTEWSVRGGDGHGAPRMTCLMFTGADLPRHLSSRLRNLNKCFIIDLS